MAQDPRINVQIRVPQVRLIDADGSQLGIVGIREAIATAEERGQDLVEVAPNAVPPVCRIMDYGKFKYAQKKKTQEARKRQTQVVIKEVKMRPKTEEHDYQFKLRNARKFLEQKNKVKMTVVFRGREMAHTDIGRGIMDRVVQEIQDVASVEKAASMEGRAMTMILSPR
ncbi:MAG: translation initiation factor IF-3 [Pseudomonadota bacterium]